MRDTSQEIDSFRKVARVEANMRWYAIADSAQHNALPKAIVHGSYNARCLLGATEGSPLAQQSPHLVEISSPLEASKSWNWIIINAKSKPCVSILATTKSFDELFDQLSAAIDVMLPGGDSMYLAFWDPAILGTLMGQPDDETLYVKGPVFNVEQQKKIMMDLSGWWYWGRTGNIHSIKTIESTCHSHKNRTCLSQDQVDTLVEASVPDHVLYYIGLNQPHLFAGIASEQRYSSVSRAVGRARKIGLTGMRDLVNYVCVELIYKERMHDKAVRQILEKVQSGYTDFDAALDQLP